MKNELKQRIIASILSYLILIESINFYQDVKIAINNKKNTEKYTKMFEEQKNMEKIAYKELCADYNSYIDLISKEMNMINMSSNVMDAFACYITLQNTGLISYGDEFLCKDIEFELLSEMGINVSIGYGVCRNQASNLNRILQSLGFDSIEVIGELYRGEPNNKSNHMVVYVRENGIDYLLDPTNETIFLRNEKGEYISLINKGTKFIPDYKTNMIYGYDVSKLSISKQDDTIHSLQLEKDYYSSFMKAIKYLRFYQQYEELNLNPIEDNIKESFNKYLEENKSLTNTIN